MESQSTVLAPDLKRALQSTKCQLLDARDRTDALIDAIDKFLHTNGAYPIPDAFLAPPSIGPTAGTKSKGNGKEKVRPPHLGIAETVVQLLSAKGPMRTPDILKALVEVGSPAGGKRPIQTLYGILHKDAKSQKPRFKRTSRGLWRTV
jgi:hypothetical protein